MVALQRRTCLPFVNACTLSLSLPLPIGDSNGVHLYIVTFTHAIHTYVQIQLQENECRKNFFSLSLSLSFEKCRKRNSNKATTKEEASVKNVPLSEQLNISDPNTLTAFSILCRKHIETESENFVSELTI